MPFGALWRNPSCRQALRIERLLNSNYTGIRSCAQVGVTLNFLKETGIGFPTSLRNIQHYDENRSESHGSPCVYVWGGSDTNGCSNYGLGSDYRRIRSWKEFSQSAQGSLSIDTNGVSRLYAFTAVNTSGQSDLHVVIGIPSDVAFADANQNLARNLTGLAIGAIFALLAARWGANAFILRHVDSLVAATKRLTSGDLSARAGYSGGGELGVLACAFDEMAQTLERRALEPAARSSSNPSPDSARRSAGSHCRQAERTSRHEHCSERRVRRDGSRTQCARGEC